MLVCGESCQSTHISIHDGDLIDREMRERIACFDFETTLEVRKLVVVLSHRKDSRDEREYLRRHTHVYSNMVETGVNLFVACRV